MSPPAVIQAAAEGDRGAGQRGLAGLHAELESLASARGVAERAPREAALALARALLRHHGLVSSRRAGALERHAAVGLQHLDLGPAPASAQDLARLFEQAIGRSARRDHGAVYTPPEVVRFIVREALAARVATALDVSLQDARAVLWDGEAKRLSRSRKERLRELFAGLSILDPAAGAGAFLIGAARELASLVRSLHDAGVAGLDDLLDDAGALRRCHGFELDADAASIANSVLALTVGSARTDLEPVRVTARNALIDGLEHPAAPDGWDVVVMNPPYVGEKLLAARLGHDARSALKARDGFGGDLLAHFVVRALDGVRTGGVVSAIVSDTMLTMGSSAPLRRMLLDEARLRSVAWSRPFESVAVHAGILTVTREPAREDDRVECVAEDDGARLASAGREVVPLSAFRTLPHRALYRPSRAARTMVDRWDRVADLEGLWDTARAPAASPSEAAQPGDWTLLGAVTRSGQGLATGDDRRFVGFVAGTVEARRALQRQSRIAAALRSDPGAAAKWAVVRERMSRGCSLERALLSLLDLRDEGEAGELPERKPFRVVPAELVRRTPLSAGERVHGIQDGPTWVRYETSDRSSARGGAAWVRENPVVIDWSAESVAILRHRRAHGPRTPVLRNEDLWFAGGVTHNRVASYLRARLLPSGAIFSSESPIYVSAVEWLDEHSLLALLNAPIVEFAIKTFLATRNHFEVGHLRRLPIPVLDADEQAELRQIGIAAVAATRDDDAGRLSEIERDLDAVTRRLYGVPKRLLLPVRR